ncbi:hypothetical protein [Candidatus Poriferisocius sp.]|uniref:hypothetical protein n=1 Tax=Candidatus Poriferisocius sp. TaxID=3101276 RepID=UPI003B59C1ED
MGMWTYDPEEGNFDGIAYGFLVFEPPCMYLEYDGYRTLLRLPGNFYDWDGMSAMLSTKLEVFADMKTFASGDFVSAGGGGYPDQFSAVCPTRSSFLASTIVHYESTR